MFSVMIVDDEKHLVEVMEETIPWSKVEIDQVYKAYSAEQALQLIRTYAIDIVITDIKMPGMSGLELIEHVHKQSRQIKCILLSGYAEFNYARKALALDAAQYLLKPATDDEVLEAVKRACEQLRSQWNAIASEQKALLTIREHLPMLRSNLLNELLSGRRISERNLTQKLEMYNLNIKLQDTIAMLLMRIEGKKDNIEEYHDALMEFAITNIAEEILCEHFEIWIGKDIHEQLVVITGVRDQREILELEPPLEFTQLLEVKAAELQQKIKQFLKLSVSVLVTPWFSFSNSSLKETYDRSLSILRQKAWNGEELFIDGSETPLFDNTSLLKCLYEPPMLHQLIDSGKWDDVEKRLNDIFEELETDWTDSVEHIMEVFFAITNAFVYLAHKNGLRLFQMIGEEQTLLFNHASFTSIKILKEWAFRILAKMKTHFADNLKGRRQVIIEEAQRHVMEHLGHDLTLYDIAERIGIHPVYLSRIYKLETGESLTEYVYRLKMEKAAYLLKHSDLRIYEIAAQLGYQNPQYLSKLFRRQYQMSPQEFRDQS